MKRTVRSLVVDDDPTTRLILKTLLGEFGPVSEAANGLEGVYEFRRAAQHNQPYHLIVLDLSMPVMDGGIALECIRGLEFVHHVRPKSIVLVMAAELSAGIVQRALRLGADGCLACPVNAEQVELKVPELFNIPLNEGLGSIMTRPRPAHRS